MRRQQLLEEDIFPRYRVLMDEAVLHRAVGGPEVMAAQLAKVLDAEKRGKVTVQVVPFETGAYVAQDSNFILFEFEEGPLSPPVVFVEGRRAISTSRSLPTLPDTAKPSNTCVMLPLLLVIHSSVSRTRKKPTLAQNVRLA